MNNARLAIDRIERHVSWMAYALEALVHAHMEQDDYLSQPTKDKLRFAIEHLNKGEVTK